MANLLPVSGSVWYFLTSFCSLHGALGSWVVGVIFMDFSVDFSWPKELEK